jgi:hypothetical protein
MHASPVQQGSDAHDCPYWPHAPPVLPLSLGPASAGGGGGGGGAVQVPDGAPGGITHVIPAQQSALDVHAPLEGMQADAAQVSCPPAPGTHGTPLQQSLAVEHVCPVWRQAFAPPSAPPPKARHRGTPRLSSWQRALFGWPLTSQQSAAEADTEQL